MKKIVITEFMSQDAVDRLSSKFHVIYDKGLADKERALHKLITDCDALIVRNRTQVSRVLLEPASKLVVVGRLGVGLDNIDLPACKNKSIKVIPATGANNIAVAEYVISGVLSLIRGCYYGTHKVLDGSWPRTEQIGSETYGKILGLIGFGGIAKDVAQRGVALGMKIVAYDPFIPYNASVWTEYSVKPLELNELLGISNAISLHIPLTNETRHLLNEESFKKIKRGAVLINSARGGVVSETAMVKALREGILKGALIDVFENEPLPAGSVLNDAPNCILTAHVAGVTQEANERVSWMIAKKVAESLGEVL